MLVIQKKKNVELFYLPKAIKEWLIQINIDGWQQEFIAPFDKIAKGLFTLTSIVQFMMVLMLRIAAAMKMTVRCQIMSHLLTRAMVVKVQWARIRQKIA